MESSRRRMSYLNIDNVSHFVGGQVGRQVLDALAFVGPREHVSGASAVTLWIRHLADLWLAAER